MAILQLGTQMKGFATNAFGAKAIKAFKAAHIENSKLITADTADRYYRSFNPGLPDGTVKIFKAIKTLSLHTDLVRFFRAEAKNGIAHEVLSNFWKAYEKLAKSYKGPAGSSRLQNLEKTLADATNVADKNSGIHKHVVDLTDKLRHDFLKNPKKITEATIPVGEYIQGVSKGVFEELKMGLGIKIPHNTNKVPK